jgi:hypothetical protein
MLKESAAVGASVFLPRYGGAQAPKEQTFLRRFFPKSGPFLTLVDKKAENKKPGQSRVFPKAYLAKTGISLGELSSVGSSC